VKNDYGPFRGADLPWSPIVPEEEIGMARDGRRASQVARFVFVLLVGVLAGSAMLAPVGAHVTSFSHLAAKHFFTKKAADSRFINVGEAAKSATTATNAENADKLDSLDSAAFQKSGCADGNVMGYARILPGFYGPSYSTVPIAFTCLSGLSVRAKQASVGVFTIDFGFDGTPCGQHVPIVSAEQDGDIRSHSASEGTDCVVVVETFDAEGIPLGLIFNLAVMRAAN
jgi:hypothetical protein